MRRAPSGAPKNGPREGLHPNSGSISANPVLLLNFPGADRCILRRKHQLPIAAQKDNLGQNTSRLVTQQLERNGRHRNKFIRTTLALLGAAALLTLLGPLLFAQRGSRVTGVDPSSGKVDDTVTVAGENLGKGAVSAAFLSDDKTDYKATLVEQDAEKIVIKVPHVKPGSYNISILTGNTILIQPVRFTVQE